MDYEQSVSAQFKDRRIIALCSYLVTQCEDRQVNEVMRAHNCALEREDHTWRVVPRPGFPLNNSYRCYFTDENDRIQNFETFEGVDDAEAALKAQQLVSSSRFASAEVWHGKRLIGRWVNHDFSKRTARMNPPGLCCLPPRTAHPTGEAAMPSRLRPFLLR
jgi:hypothetical protein